MVNPTCISGLLGLHICLGLSEAHAHRYAPLTSLNYYLLLTGLAGDTVPMPAIAEVDQNLTATVTDTIATLIPCEDEQHAEILILQCEYFSFFVCIFHFPFLFSLA